MSETENSYFLIFQFFEVDAIKVGRYICQINLTLNKSRMLK